MTRFQLHCHTWRDGCGSEFCDGARKVFYRGDIPCDILFVGEAPGKSENAAGIPFHPGAPAGKLLMHIIKRSVIRHHKTIQRAGRAGSKTGPQTVYSECTVCGKCEGELDTSTCLPYKIGFTNVVSCIPRDPDSTDKLTEPSADQVDTCKPRLEDILAIASPRLIVAVGKVAENALARGYLVSVKIPNNCAVTHIVHPAFILRQATAFQGLEVQRCCIAIKDAIHLLEGSLHSRTTSNPLKVEESEKPGSRTNPSKAGSAANPKGPILPGATTSYEDGIEFARQVISKGRKASTQPANSDIIPTGSDGWAIDKDRPDWDTDDIPF